MNPDKTDLDVIRLNSTNHKNRVGAILIFGDATACTKVRKRADDSLFAVWRVPYKARITVYGRQRSSEVERVCKA